jgi:hypothetical protein
MTEAQLVEALRLIASGRTIGQAADAVFCEKAALARRMKLRGYRVGRPKRVELSQAQLVGADRRHVAGETWAAIAASLGVPRLRLKGCIYYLRYKDARDGGALAMRRYPAREAKSVKSASIVEPHIQRTIARTLKSPDEVMALARLFVAGEITRGEFCHGIRA